jgi:UDP-N-acetylglucosamine--N-acetylmuramyl-(pentapeptide) pyrophosphoryl-undecaprenol N-acetylglucosamine transferase
MTQPTLLVATSGGHIDELYELAKQLAPDPSARVWVTSPTPQTTSLLSGELVEWVPPVGSRQAGRALWTFPRALSIIRRVAPREVISTGAALAVPFVTAARLSRLPVRFIESATRIEGPSLTGRLLEWLPGTELLHQELGWERRRWRSTPSVFEGYRTYDRSLTAHEPIRILVTLGTERFPFTRAVHAIASSLPACSEVVWQLGHTPAHPGMPGTTHTWMSYSALVDAAEHADVVIEHAGVGSILMALRAGKVPIVFARSCSYGEHIDDHQTELADALSREGLVSVGTLDCDALRQQILLTPQRGASRSNLEWARTE